MVRATTLNYFGLLAQIKLPPGARCHLFIGLKQGYPLHSKVLGMAGGAECPTFQTFLKQLLLSALLMGTDWTFFYISIYRKERKKGLRWDPEKGEQLLPIKISILETIGGCKPKGVKW